MNKNKNDYLSTPRATKGSPRRLARWRTGRYASKGNEDRSSHCTVIASSRSAASRTGPGSAASGSLPPATYASKALWNWRSTYSTIKIHEADVGKTQTEQVWKFWNHSRIVLSGMRRWQDIRKHSHCYRVGLTRVWLFALSSGVAGAFVPLVVGPRLGRTGIKLSLCVESPRESLALHSRRTHLFSGV